MAGFNAVIPAKAGIQYLSVIPVQTGIQFRSGYFWIPDPGSAGALRRGESGRE